MNTLLPAFLCDCGERFSSQDALREHKLLKHVNFGLPHYGCRNCNERFETMKGLNQHKRDSHGWLRGKASTAPSQPQSAWGKYIDLQQQFKSIYKELEAERDALLDKANVITAKLEQMKKKSTDGNMI